MKVKITTRQVYHKIASVEVNIPNHIKLEDVSEYLNEHSEVYVDEMQYKLNGADSGKKHIVTRYDVESKNYGGHL
jgi:hypothetical protein